MNDSIRPQTFTLNAGATKVLSNISTKQIGCFDIIIGGNPAPAARITVDTQQDVAFPMKVGTVVKFKTERKGDIEIKNLSNQAATITLIFTVDVDLGFLGSN